MTRDYRFADSIALIESIALRVESQKAANDVAERQRNTAAEILRRFRDRPGVVLADEVGMGKTFVALAVAASVILRNPKAGPVVVMVPSGLKEKWPREWRVFRSRCLKARRTEIRATDQTAVESGVEFLKLLDDDPPAERKNLIFLTHGALSRGLTDPLVKLALVGRVLRRPSLASQRQAAPRFVGEVIYGLKRHGGYYEQLLVTPPERWRETIKNAGFDADDDPVPKHLVKAIDDLDDAHLDQLAESLRSLPCRWSGRLNKRLGQTAESINTFFRDIWEHWLAKACHRASFPLLILDEAHHLKNPHTNLPSLFHEREAETDSEMLSSRGPLQNVFERMLFLTATPFQLGHRELLRVLDRFENIAWNCNAAPRLARETVRDELKILEGALDKAQFSALAFDRTWGRLRNEDLGGASVDSWWRAVRSGKPTDNMRDVEIRRAYDETNARFREAEKLLQSWVVRHLKPRSLSERGPLGEEISRRKELVGAAIQGGEESRGLLVSGEALLPFLLAARAQAAVAATEEGRALFAEGLASSYEAFLETRCNNGERDEDEDHSGALLPVELRWYLDNLARTLPQDDATARAGHPKIAATVAKAVELWRAGEKVLIFCHYRATGRALRQHLSRALDEDIVSEAKKRFGWRSDEEARRKLKTLGRRFQNEKDRLCREANLVFFDVLTKYPDLVKQRPHVLKILRRFVCTPSFLVRCFPQNPGPGAMERALAEQDASGATLRHRLERFCEFLARQCTPDERDEFVRALLTLQTGRHRFGRERLLANVQLVNGETDAETRRRVLLTFNTPFFPEILVASSVLSEGVDLHLQCRHVIHHDLCWNPSTLEQRTGRVDRVGAKVEWAQKPIHVYLPYVEATQDEKMFRVVRRRARWFQVVMGEKFEVAEAATDREAERVPLPENVTAALAFRLEVSAPQTLRVAD